MLNPRGPLTFKIVKFPVYNIGKILFQTLAKIPREEINIIVYREQRKHRSYFRVRRMGEALAMCVVNEEVHLTSPERAKVMDHARPE